MILIIIVLYLQTEDWKKRGKKPSIVVYNTSMLLKIAPIASFSTVLPSKSSLKSRYATSLCRPNGI